MVTLRKFRLIRKVKVFATSLAIIFHTPAQSQTIDDLRSKLTETISACIDGFVGTARLCEGSCEKALDKIADVTSLSGITLRHKLSIGNCANILEQADTALPAFLPIITYHNTGRLPLEPVAEIEPTTPSSAPAVSVVYESLCGADRDRISELLDGDWLMRQSEGVAMVGELRLPSIAHPKGHEVDVTIGGSIFTFNTLSYEMSQIDRMTSLFEEREDMKQWLPQAMEKAPLATRASCDTDWPVFRVYGKASSGYHSEIDIRLIAYSSTCMVGVHSGINAQFNGDLMPSAVYGVVLHKGASGCD